MSSRLASHRLHIIAKFVQNYAKQLHRKVSLLASHMLWRIARPVLLVTERFHVWYFWISSGALSRLKGHLKATTHIKWKGAPSRFPVTFFFSNASWFSLSSLSILIVVLLEFFFFFFPSRLRDGRTMDTPALDQGRRPTSLLKAATILLAHSPIS